MLSIGFEKQIQPTILGPTSSEDTVYVFTSKNYEYVLEVYNFLQKEIEIELEIDPELRPVYLASAEPRVGSALAATFDPFKANFVSTSGPEIKAKIER
jgi:hypothetical protein